MTQIISFRFDPEKAVEVILYIAQNAPIPDIYHIGKILYFADRKHLEEYGRFVCGDKYIKMEDGPVPSSVYDLIKYVRGDGKHLKSEIAKKSFDIQKNNHNIIPLRGANLSMLSESERECLDKSILENGKLSYDKLKEKSHDRAYGLATDRNITVAIIASTLKDPELILSHLQENY